MYSLYYVLLFLLWFHCLFYLYIYFMFLFFFKQKTAYEMRISDWSSDVCSSDLQFLDRIPNIATGRDKALHPHLIEQQINSARQVAYLAEVDRITLPIRDRHERATAQGGIGRARAGEEAG